MRVRVLSVFGVATLQDGGRNRFRKFGVPEGGAFDIASLETANALLGNHPHAPAIEFALGTLELEAVDKGTLGFYGAAPGIEVNGVTFEAARSLDLNPGDQVRVLPTNQGLRTYVSSPGGFVAPIVLESVSGAPVEAGATLVSARDEGALGARSCRPFVCDHETPLRVLPVAGESGAWQEQFRISRNIDRVGIRLEGPPVTHAQKSVRSEPSVFGAVQVTGDGTLIIHGPDGPTIGGYAKIGCVVRADLARLGQLHPGANVSFRTVDPKEASQLWEEELARRASLCEEASS